MTTLYLLSEQVRRLIAPVRPNQDNIRIEEIALLVKQTAQAMVRERSLGEAVSMMNEFGVNHACIHEFTVPVTAAITEITLPVFPVSLPRDMGIWMVYDKRYEDLPFIPIPSHMRHLMSTDLGKPEGNNRYTVVGDKLRIKTPVENTEIVVEMIATAIDHLTPNAVLKVPQDMERDIITAVVSMLAPMEAGPKDEDFDGKSKAR